MHLTACLCAPDGWHRGRRAWVHVRAGCDHWRRDVHIRCVHQPAACCLLSAACHLLLVACCLLSSACYLRCLLLRTCYSSSLLLSNTGVFAVYSWQLRHGFVHRHWSLRKEMRSIVRSYMCVDMKPITQKQECSRTRQCHSHSPLPTSRIPFRKLAARDRPAVLKGRDAQLSTSPQQKLPGLHIFARTVLLFSKDGKPPPFPPTSLAAASSK